MRIGYFRTLIIGLIMQSVVIAAFAILAYTGPDVRVFGAVMAVDNFGVGFAGVALVTYMSSLTTMRLHGDAVRAPELRLHVRREVREGVFGRDGRIAGIGRTLLEGYALFFIGAGLLGVRRCCA